MPGLPLNRAEIIDFALLTAQKIEAEARNNPPNLRRLALLANMYDSCASKAADMPSPSLPCPENDELFLLDEDLTVTEQPPAEVPSVIEDSSSSDESDDSDSEADAEEALPPYTSHPTPSEVIISDSDYWSKSDVEDNSTLLDFLTAAFVSPDFHDTEKSNSKPSRFIEHVEETLVGSAKGAATDCKGVPLQRCRSESREPKPRRPQLVHRADFRAIAAG